MQDEEKKNVGEEQVEGEEVHQSIAAHLWENRHKTSADAEIYVPLDTSGATTAGRVQNFWYHHKFTVIVAAFLALVLIVCCVQFATKPKYDAYVLYAGPWMECDKGESISAVQNAILTVMEDYDGNGKKSVSYKPLFLMTDAQINDYYAAYEGNEENMPNLNTWLIKQNTDQLEAEIMSGMAQVCFVDPAAYETMLDSGFLVPLTAFADTLPENGYDNYAVRLADTDFGKYLAGVQDMPADTLLCFRRTGVLNENETRTSRNETLMRAILNYRVSAE